MDGIVTLSSFWNPNIRATPRRTPAIHLISTTGSSTHMKLQVVQRVTNSWQQQQNFHVNNARLTIVAEHITYMSIDPGIPARIQVLGEKARKRQLRVRDACLPIQVSGMNGMK
eukprot:scaffold4025_cov106-Cylindrotheca_fusiformis.AAC.1